MTSRAGGAFLVLSVLAIRAGLVYGAPAPAPSAAFLFEHLGMEKGLSQSTVRCVFQDHLGFLWFGTQDGLNKYDGYSFTVYRHRAGEARSLPDNSVAAITETRDGLLWIGTVGGGVAAFHRDTEQFEAYRHDSAQPASLADNHVTALLVDSAGALWIGTGLSGIDRWNEQQRGFLHHRHDPANPASLASDRIAALVEGHPGRLWVGFADLGVDGMDARTGEAGHYRHSPQDLPHSLSSDAVTCLYWQAAQEALWIGTHLGLNRLDPQTGSFAHWQQQDSPKAGLADDLVNAVIESVRGGGLWIATANGLDRMEPSGEIAHFRTNPLDPLSLSSNVAVSLLEDRSGLLWIGTDNRGVSKGRRTRFTTYHNLAGGLPDPKMDAIRAVTKDGRGVVWLGTIGAGLVGLDRARGQMTHYQNEPGNPRSLAVNHVTALWAEPPPSDLLWVGTSLGLGRLDVRTGVFTQISHEAPDQSTPNGYVVWAIHEDRRGALWVGTAGGLALLDRRTGRLHRVQHERAAMAQDLPDNVRAMAEDRDGRLWLGTRSGGLALFDPQTGDCQHFRHEANNPQSISTDAVYAVHVSRTGQLWAGTTAGIELLDRAHGTFQHFGETQGLANETIYAMLEDEAGDLWISTDKGLSRFNPTTRTFTNYDVSDGLQGNEFNGGAAFQSPDGELFFGGINGLNAFYPKNVADRPFQPAVVFTAARKLDRVVTGIDQRPRITLQATDPVFSVEFAALDYAVPEKNQYAYTLEGFDQGWAQSGTRRFASYTNLDGGTYVLRVRGTNGDGRWSAHEAVLAIEVIPPFWKTWWFRAGAIAAVLGLFLVVYQRRSASLTRARVAQEEFSRKLIESQETERKRIASELHDSLGQNLIVIKNHALLGMVAGASPESAVQRLETISEMASEAIDEVREISRNLRPYQLDRFGLTRSLASLVDRAAVSANGIEFVSQIDSVDGLLSKEMEINLYRIVQESVTNVFKHAQATRASLVVLRESYRMVVTVQDNGRGLPVDTKADAARGFGLVGMAERARILGARHEIRSGPGQGTTVMIEIPLG